MKHVCALLPSFALLAVALHAQGPSAADAAKPLPPIAEKTSGMQSLPGYFNLYWDAKAGRLWLEIDKWKTEFLYLESLPAGIGSNDIGLDRGQMGEPRVVRFERSGPRVLLIQPNYGFRAITDNPDERRSVTEAFAESTLWGFTVAAESGDRVLVDTTDFYLRDAHNVIGTLKRTNQGVFHLDPSRCALYLPRTKNFPQNTEVEATLTFTGDDPGPFVRQVVPTPEAITVREHQSFVQLPSSGFKPRVFDPRAGYIGTSYMDYATPVSEPIVKRFILRHRLEKKDPKAGVSEPVKPIVYYLDRGTPEPVRSALLEGARWWNEAFEAAGYKDAFSVELLPEGADAMDVRYNVIQWVHRATRGWSYGAPIYDPRTGEIIKGQVTLGSLRVRQDYLIAEGLLAPYEKGKPVSPKMLEMALARLRQLAAHEVGHTLGLMHNFAASTVNRASVMDYPPPLAKLGTDGVPDLSNAYATGVGTWDKVAIAFGYQDFPPGIDEAAVLNKMLTEAITSGQRYLTDQDARSPSSASPIAHLWDGGTNAVDELDRVLQVRAAALRRFSENNIRESTPLAALEDVLVPIYMYHRYQVEAAAKVIGGLNYSFALRGDGQIPAEVVDAREQRRALDGVLSTLSPDALALPAPLLQLIPPRPPEYPRSSKEDFRIRTAPVFDALAPTEAAAQHTLAFLVDPDRAMRLIEFSALDVRNPGFGEILDKTIAATWKSSRATGYHAEIQRVVSNVVLYDLITLVMNNNAADQVRATAALKLNELRDWLTAQLPSVSDESWRAHFFFAISQIKQLQEDPKQLNLTRPNEPPEGQPIGSDPFAACDDE